MSMLIDTQNIPVNINHVTSEIATRDGSSGCS